MNLKRNKASASVNTLMVSLAVMLMGFVVLLSDPSCSSFLNDDLTELNCEDSAEKESEKEEKKEELKDDELSNSFQASVAVIGTVDERSSEIHILWEAPLRSLTDPPPEKL